MQRSVQASGWMPSCYFSTATERIMNIQGMLTDHLGFFTPHHVLNAVLSLLVATLLGYLLARVGGRLAEGASRGLALWAALSAVALTFVRSLPLAVALVALVLLLRGADHGIGDRRLLLGALLLGAACGSGATVAAVAVGVPLILLFRWVRSDG